MMRCSWYTLPTAAMPTTCWHDPKDLITKITGCSPGDEGSQVWEDALWLFFCGDQALIDYVQQVVGMAAVGKVYQEHLIRFCAKAR